MDVFDTEPRDGFRRNLLIVLAVHAVMLGAVWLFNRGPRQPAEEQITWLDGSALGGAPSAEGALPTLPDLPAKAQEPEPEPEAQAAPPSPEPKPAEPDPIPAEPPPKLPEPIAAPKPTPQPTPAPTPKPAAKATPAPKSTPRPVVKKKPTPAPKKIAAPTTAPKLAAKTASANPTAKPTSAKTASAGDGSRAGAPNGSANGSVSAAELQNYFGAVGEEFRGCWKTYKPLFGESSGGSLTAMVHVRIDRSGSVVEATLTRSTGNQDVDASIRKAFTDFKRVPAPPTALLKSGIFESNMAVILSI
jgi:TonB family protein